MRRIRRIGALMICAILGGRFFLVIFAPASAQERKVVLLQPLPGIANEVGLDAYVEGMFGVIIVVTGGASVIMLFAGSIQYMSTDAISGKTDGREKITDSMTGLALALSSWLIAAAIFGNLNADNDIFIPLIVESAKVEGEGEVPPDDDCPPDDDPRWNTFDSNEQAVRDRLRAGCIAVNSPTPCPEGISYECFTRRTGRRCTTVGGLTEDTITGALNLIDHCFTLEDGTSLADSCEHSPLATISGGNETGHAVSGRGCGHGDGRKIDISLTRDGGEVIRQCIEEVLGPLPLNRRVCGIVGGRNICVRRESTHLDIDFCPP